MSTARRRAREEDAEMSREAEPLDARTRRLLERCRTDPELLTRCCPSFTRARFVPPEADVAAVARSAPRILADEDSEFLWSNLFEAETVAGLASFGFLPMATHVSDRCLPLFLPKLHQQRCLIELVPGAVVKRSPARRCARVGCAAPDTASLKTCARCRAVAYCSAGCQKLDWRAGHKAVCAAAAPAAAAEGGNADAAADAAADADDADDDAPPPRQRTVRKSDRKKAKKFRLSVDTAWDAVVGGCRDQHGPSRNWLYPDLVRAYEQVRRGPPERYRGVRFHSIEVWSEASGALVAGELGYSFGASYTSLTGYHEASGAGTVQLLALRGLLLEQGFRLWDLGMGMAYKDDLGAVEVQRADFVTSVAAAKSAGARLLRCPERRAAVELLG